MRAARLIFGTLLLFVVLAVYSAMIEWRSSTPANPSPPGAVQVGGSSEAEPAVRAPAVSTATIDPPATVTPVVAGGAPTPPASPTAQPQPTLLPAPAKPSASPAPVSAVLARSVAPALPAPPAAPDPFTLGSPLPLPAGTSVVRGGCASDGVCHRYNYYWAPTREVVMQLGEGQHKVQHELCHAHQHWSINGGTAVPPSDYDLGSWYGTAEGRSFVAAVDGSGWPWSHSAANRLEDFAWTCAYWYVDREYLRFTSPERFTWAEANLP